MGGPGLGTRVDLVGCIGTWGGFTVRRRGVPCGRRTAQLSATLSARWRQSSTLPLSWWSSPDRAAFDTDHVANPRNAATCPRVSPGPTFCLPGRPTRKLATCLWRSMCRNQGLFAGHIPTEQGVPVAVPPGGGEGGGARAQKRWEHRMAAWHWSGFLSSLLEYCPRGPGARAPKGFARALRGVRAPDPDGQAFRPHPLGQTILKEGKKTFLGDQSRSPPLLLGFSREPGLTRINGPDAQPALLGPTEGLKGAV